MKRADREAGFAMITVVLGIGALVVMVVLVFQQANAEYRNAQYQRREDTLVAGAEAMLERYAAKFTIDPIYYQRHVDEAELPRRCNDPLSPHYGTVVQPGNPWVACSSWEYEAPDSFFGHPLIDGRSDISADDIVALLTVQPPGADGGLTVTVVARQEAFNHTRAITAEIRPDAISQFVFMTLGDQRFGAGAHTYGKVYSGDDIDYRAPGHAHRDVYAEDSIGLTSGYGPPTFEDGAEGYDGRGLYKDIRTVFPEPIDFNKFWDDLALLREVACHQGGLCLSRTENPGLGLTKTPTAWRLEFESTGLGGRVRVSATYDSKTTKKCLTAEEWIWWNNGTANWQQVGLFPLPSNGAVWVDGHAVIGRTGQVSVIEGAVTVSAGQNGSPKNIIIATDIEYFDPGGTDVIGLIATDWVIVDPHGIGADLEMNISGAMLEQGGALLVSRDCGTSGSTLYPVRSTTPVLNMNGSQARIQTGSVSHSFAIRNYGFDERLANLRPPLFPLVSDRWAYENWKEIQPPCWARPDSPNCP